MPWPGALPESLKVYVRKENIRGLKVAQTRGLGGMLPQRMFKFRVSEMDIFSKKIRSKVQYLVVYFTHLLSLVLSVGKTVMPSRRFQGREVYPLDG